jgi:hypothetical protein
MGLGRSRNERPGRPGHSGRHARRCEPGRRRDVSGRAGSSVSICPCRRSTVRGWRAHRHGRVRPHGRAGGDRQPRQLGGLPNAGRLRRPHPSHRSAAIVQLSAQRTSAVCLASRPTCATCEYIVPCGIADRPVHVDEEGIDVSMEHVAGSSLSAAEAWAGSTGAPGRRVASSPTTCRPSRGKTGCGVGRGGSRRHGPGLRPPSPRSPALSGAAARPARPSRRVRRALPASQSGSGPGAAWPRGAATEADDASSGSSPCARRRECPIAGPTARRPS